MTNCNKCNGTGNMGFTMHVRCDACDETQNPPDVFSVCDEEYRYDIQRDVAIGFGGDGKCSGEYSVQYIPAGIWRSGKIEEYREWLRRVAS